MLSDWLLRLRALFRRAAVEDEIDDELRFHLERQVERYVARGFTRADAVRQARLEFGGLAQAKEEYRDALGIRLIDALGRDLRLALRALRTTPVVTAVAVLSLALGIGANTAIFSLIESLMLRPLPVREPERLVFMTSGTSDTYWNYPAWEQMREQDVFERVAAWSRRQFDLSSGGETQFVDGLWASGAFFDTLGVSALVGRTFSEADDHSSGGPDGPVAVIGYGFWQRQFGGDPNVLGRSLTVDGAPFTIIGVAPASFFGMEVGRTFDIAAPLEMNPGSLSRSANARWLTILGRLKAGQTIDDASVVLQGLQPGIREAATPPNATGRFRETYLQEPFAVASAATGRSELRRQYERPLFAIMAVVALVMLVACANIANLLLARAAARRHEFGVRLALGAPRWRLVQQVLAESLVLAALGTGLGLALASWGSRALVRELAKQTDLESTTAFLDLSLNWNVVTFTIGAAVVTVLLFGVAPARRTFAMRPVGTLKEGRGGLGDARTRLSSSLVVAQLALSVVLLVAAGLFLRTFASLVTLPLGFDSERVLVATVTAERAPGDPSQRVPLFERALDAVLALPNVADAAASLVSPVEGRSLENQITVSGALPERDPGVLVNMVSPSWFRALGIDLIAGRHFTDADRPGVPSVAIVNEAFARRFFDGSSPLGQAIGGLPVDPRAVPIVGVTSDAVYSSLRDGVLPTVYLPFAQSREPGVFGLMSLSIRASTGSWATLTRSVTAALNTVNPDLSWTFRPLDEQIDASITQERITGVLSGFFGALALLLAGLGLYGVTSYGVVRRKGEIGIRVALGATPGNVVRLVLSRVALLVGIGAFAGLLPAHWSVSSKHPTAHSPSTLLRHPFTRSPRSYAARRTSFSTWPSRR